MIDTARLRSANCRLSLWFVVVVVAMFGFGYTILPLLDMEKFVLLVSHGQIDMDRYIERDILAYAQALPEK